MKSSIPPNFIVVLQSDRPSIIYIGEDQNSTCRGVIKIAWASQLAVVPARAMARRWVVALNGMSGLPIKQQPMKNARHTFIGLRKSAFNVCESRRIQRRYRNYIAGKSTRCLRQHRPWRHKCRVLGSTESKIKPNRSWKCYWRNQFQQHIQHYKYG